MCPSAGNNRREIEAVTDINNKAPRGMEISAGFINKALPKVEAPANLVRREGESVGFCQTNANRPGRYCFVNNAVSFFFFFFFIFFPGYNTNAKKISLTAAHSDLAKKTTSRVDRIPMGNMYARFTAHVLVNQRMEQVICVTQKIMAKYM